MVMNSPGSEAASTISVRPVEPNDQPFLLRLYESTRAAEMALVPWSPEQQQAFISMQFTAQQDHYRKRYPAAAHEIILGNQQPIGQMFVARLENEIRIVDFTVIPERRNAGVGSFLLRGLLEEAASTGKAVRIYVEEFNPSLRLFERMGFKQIAQENMHLLLQWTANGKTTDG